MCLLFDNDVQSAENLAVKPDRFGSAVENGSSHGGEIENGLGSDGSETAIAVGVDVIKEGEKRRRCDIGRPIRRNQEHFDFIGHAFILGSREIELKDCVQETEEGGIENDVFWSEWRIGRGFGDVRNGLFENGEKHGVAEDDSGASECGVRFEYYD